MDLHVPNDRKFIYSFYFDRQYQEKEKIFKKELSTLSTLLPTLHTHLVTCSAFTSSANRFEFLDLAYVRIFSCRFVFNYYIFNLLRVNLLHILFFEQKKIINFFFVQRIKCVQYSHDIRVQIVHHFPLQILMDRLKSIINQQHPLHPSQSGQITTHYKVQYSK